MRKTILFGLVGILTAVSANAGLLNNFGITKTDAAPTTFTEACNKDEITKICPEIVLGNKTLAECLTENVSSLSEKCATFVKNTAKDKLNELTGGLAGKADETQATADAKKAEVSAQVDSVKEAGNTLKETGNSLKNLF